MNRRTARWLFAAVLMAGAAIGGVFLFSRDEAAAVSLRADSKRGLYTVHLVPERSPPRVGELHRWLMQLREKATGRPIERARILVSGGMRAHGHGLPTSPQVQRIAAGQFVLHGVKFSMPGDWNLDLHMDGDAGDDEVTFELSL